MTVNMFAKIYFLSFLIEWMIEYMYGFKYDINIP